MGNGKTNSLHSGYNPRGEAERYIASLDLGVNTRHFILIEPGLGYIIAPLRKKAPGAHVVVLHAGELHCTAAEGPPVPEWRPGSGSGIQEFLESEIPDSEAGCIKILEWRPALSSYGAAYLKLVEEAAKYIKRADANHRTVMAFGRRWFRNFIRNTEIIREAVSPLRLSAPIVVTGAGPGLEEAIPLIWQESRKTSLFVLAVSSSAMALEAGGISPDMTISTDGGEWARWHLHGIFRGSHPGPLAAAMTAALPSQCADMPVLPLSDGSLWQTIILKDLGIPYLCLPQRGTVAASALDLAYSLTDGNVYIAGLDLENRDIRSHARPYSLDCFLEEKEARLNPFYSQTYKRSAMIRAGGSFDIYASWFETQLASYPRRLFSLGKNNPLFNALEAEGCLKGCQSPFPEIKTIVMKEKPGKNAFSVLERALRYPETAEKLAGELSALLFPGRGNVCLDEIAQELRTEAERPRRGTNHYG